MDAVARRKKPQHPAGKRTAVVWSLYCLSYRRSYKVLLEELITLNWERNTLSF
jgi:hypothetical protein